MPADPPDGLLLLDKPEGFSSTQALAKAKRLLGARKAGHTGTLDPFATGLLPLVFGEATKFSRFLLDATKAYSATLRLGVETTTGDTEGIELNRRPVAVDLQLIDAVLRSFVGVRDQVPPMHSAVRVGGKRLYELARKGQEIERPPRRIEILALHRESWTGDELVISVRCSKGTYVRTLGAEIGHALGCGAYLIALRRTEVGPLRLADACRLEDLARLAACARERLLPVETLVEGLPRWNCGPSEMMRFSQGQEIEGPGAPAGADIAVYGPDCSFLGVGRACTSARVAPLRLMSTARRLQVP